MKQSLAPPPQSPTQFPSRSSLALSDTATFHSAHVELETSSPLNKVEMEHAIPIQKDMVGNTESASYAMERSDSGYAPGETTSNRRSTSTSSSSRDPTRKRVKSYTNSSNTKSPRTSSSSTRRERERPVPKRASRSSPSTSSNIRTSRRPSLQSRYTTDPNLNSTIRPHHQFFQFPTLGPSPADPSLLQTQQLQQEPEEAPTPVPIPVQKPIYWTSPSSRRLEYAAIDACSHGVRGFFVKLVPDCVLPKEFRSTWRSRFHHEDDDDIRSVRRYRIEVDDDDEGDRIEKLQARVGLVRRLTGLGRK